MRSVPCDHLLLISSGHLVNSILCFSRSISSSERLQNKRHDDRAKRSFSNYHIDLKRDHDPEELNDISIIFNEEKERLITELEKMKKETNANAVIVNPKY